MQTNTVTTLHRGGAEQKSGASRLPEDPGTRGMAQRAGKDTTAHALQTACQASGIFENWSPAARVPGTKMGEMGRVVFLHGCARDNLETEEATLPDGADG